MAPHGDIVRLSLPLTAGVAVGVLIPASHLLALSCAAILLAVLWYCILSRTRKPSAYMVLFLATGLFVGASAALYPLPGSPGVFAGARAWLCARLEAIGFARSGTAPLVEALVLGERGGLGRDVVAAFRESGTAHILALSGLHLGIFYLCLSKLLWPLGRGPAVRTCKSVLIMAFAAAYVLLAGASASLVRALIFIILRESAAIMNRRADLVRILFASLLIHLIISPIEIRSPGFQLSYLALCGIAFLYPKMEAWYPSDGGRFDPLRRVWQAASLAISCQLFTAPAAWLHFGTLPGSFLLANILALPLATLFTGLAMTLTLLAAGGWCPAALTHAADILSGLLIGALKIIAS